MILAMMLAASCPHVFAPPVGSPLTVTTREERRLGKSAYNFTLIHHLGFTRDADGLVAELVLTSLQADAPAPIAAAFEAGEGALRDVPIRYRLSSDGCTAAPLDPANVATRMRAGGDAMLATRAAEGPAREDMARLTAHLRAMQPPEATAMLVDLIRPLLPAAGQRDAGAIVRSVASPLGGELPLSGTREVSGNVEGIFIRETYGSSTEGLLAAAAPAVAFNMEQRQRIDANTGLTIETVTDSTATIARPTGPLVQTSRKSITIALR
jgi:hypothetical protein